MEFKELIEKREAVRKFKDTPIPEETLNAVLEAGRKAPTAKNLQPQKVFVVCSEEGLKKIDEASPCRYGAPTVLLVCGDTDIAWHKTETYCTAEMDCCIVASFMMMAACDEGLGSIWIERFDDDKISELFELPANIKPILLLPIGYTSEDYQGNPNHTVRKALEETVKFI